MVAAVAAIAVFALISASLITAGRGSVAMVQAEVGRARAAAAADAGLALALDAMLNPDPAGHWALDGRTRELNFADSRLTVRLEDERGKIPLGFLDDNQAEHMLRLMGLQGDRLSVARDSFLDWSDDDDEPRPDGAENAYYAPRHIVPRNGVPRSIDELALIRGFDRPLVERLRPVVTIHWGGGPFQLHRASLEALAVMSEGEEDTPAAIQRRRELAGQVTALAFTEKDDLSGHAARVMVEARTRDGAIARRTWVVELTGAAARPYIIRSME